ncbi:hypothetical protein QCE84_14610, partial [Staphylococcus aureus]|nr:hypothetical protein [Staphylococcus aureus]
MTFTLSDEQYKNLCTNSNKLLDKLHKALKDREEYKKQRDELIGDIAKLRDSKIAYVVEFFEWFNTLETFKNWKKKPGKP